jgi:hypothetical protein
MAVVAGVALALWPLLSTRGGAQELKPAATASDLAQGIARTMAATNPAAANSPIVQQFTAHDNVVEMRTVVRDADAFARFAAHRAQTQTGMTRYLCKPERLRYIKQGVAFHEVYAGPNSGDAFDFVVDAQVCAAIAEPELADAATLTKSAAEIAERLAPQFQVVNPAGGFRIEPPTARDGVVEITHIVVAPAFAELVRLKGDELRGKTQGWFCAKVGDEIRRGVRLHVTFRLEHEPPLLDFMIDRSIC